MSNSDHRGDSPVANNDFVQKLIQAQPQMFAYAVTLLSDSTAANDVLQETNRVLLEKANQFDESREFTRWACGFIRIQSRVYFRDLGRDKHCFSGELVELIADEAEVADFSPLYQSTLRTCLEKLTDHQRMLIELRYAADSSVAKMAGELDRTPGSVSTALNKIRVALAECCQRVLATEKLA